MQDDQEALRHSVAEIVDHCRHLTAATGEWGALISLSLKGIEQKSFKGFVVSTLPCRGKIPGERVRLRWDTSNVPPMIAAFVKAALMAEFHPCGEGIRGAVFDETSEGGVIVLRDFGPNERIGVHAAPPMIL